MGEPRKTNRVDVKKLVEERRETVLFNAEQDEVAGTLDQIRGAIQNRATLIKDDEGQIESLREQIANRERAMAEHQTKIDELRDDLKSSPKPEESKPLDVIDQSLTDASDTNQKADRYERYVDLSKKTKANQKEADGLTAKLKAVTEEKKKAILESKLPFKNLEFDDTAGLLIDDIPFSQKSRAEKIRISTRIGMELSPDLRILFVEDGTLLDNESYAIVRQLADRHGYQILVEKIGEEEGSDKIVMRAGKMISAFEEKETVTQRVRKADELL